MLDTDSALYAAFIAKDSRFDGRFFVGISSTGIYCRPVCRARQPKAENCTFYTTPAQAEQEGYRPCLLCRPELAPGTSITDATARLAHKAARVLEEKCGTGESLEEIAGSLGCTDRHLRRVFTKEYNVTPLQYLQTCRLLLAKGLLTDTNLNVIDVAMASGFGSLRRFNDVFKKNYQLTPMSLRKQTVTEKQRAGGITLTEKQRAGGITLALGYRPPYCWEEMLKFLAGRAIAGIEVVKDSEYLRTVHLKNAKGKYLSGWLRVGHKPEKNALSVTVSETLLPVLPQVLARIKRLFDLYCNPHAIYETLKAMNHIRQGLCVPGIRVPGCFDAFEMAVRAVLGQQISVKSASTLAARMVRQYGIPIQTGIEGLTHAFPLPEAIIALDGSIENHLGSLGVIGTHARTIYELAQKITQEEIDLSACLHPEKEIKKLMDIQGIGSWTAQYIAMRAMEWPDAFLETDAGVKKALQPYTSKELLIMAESWRPWRSYATINLWNSL